ncbi:MAG: hypothetical protein LBD32_02965 [Cytophagales bacterium]|jgi:chemotaxis protein histidine kinase CheA|nr:hypothetical protein [Cytophagales bacterium]
MKKYYNCKFLIPLTCLVGLSSCGGKPENAGAGSEEAAKAAKKEAARATGSEKVIKERAAVAAEEAVAKAAREVEMAEEAVAKAAREVEMTEETVAKAAREAEMAEETVAKAAREAEMAEEAVAKAAREAEMAEEVVAKAAREAEVSEEATARAAREAGVAEEAAARAAREAEPTKKPKAVEKTKGVAETGTGEESGTGIGAGAVGGLEGVDGTGLENVAGVVVKTGGAGDESKEVAGLRVKVMEKEWIASEQKLGTKLRGKGEKIGKLLKGLSWESGFRAEEIETVSNALVGAGMWMAVAERLMNYKASKTNEKMAKAVIMAGDKKDKVDRARIRSIVGLVGDALDEVKRNFSGGTGKVSKKKAIDKALAEDNGAEGGVRVAIDEVGRLLIVIRDIVGGV